MRRATTPTRKQSKAARCAAKRAARAQAEIAQAVTRAERLTRERADEQAREARRAAMLVRVPELRVRFARVIAQDTGGDPGARIVDELVLRWGLENEHRLDTMLDDLGEQRVIAAARAWLREQWAAERGGRPWPKITDARIWCHIFTHSGIEVAFYVGSGDLAAVECDDSDAGYEAARRGQPVFRRVHWLDDTRSRS